MAFPRGTRVRQVLPAPIEGTVERYDVDQESGKIQVLVTWPDTNGDGTPESRFFSEDQIEAIDG